MSEARLAELSREEKARLFERLRASRGSPAGEAPIPRLAVRPDPLPLSFAQQRLWFLDRLRPGDPTYNVPAALEIAGPLDPMALRRALEALAQRHEALRTTFPEVGERPAQVVAPALAVSLPLLDLTGLPEGSRVSEAERRVGEEMLRPFDLAKGPLLRALLVRLAPERHVAVLNLHHVVCDGWSLGVLVREVAALYQAAVTGVPAALPPLPIQYADFAVWQRQWLSGERLERQLAFWRHALAGVEPLRLPTDRPRPPRRGSAGGSRPLSVAPAEAARLQALALAEKATPFIVLLAAWSTLLGRLAGQSDVAVGTPVANRNRSETAGLIGFFVNTVVLRADLSGDLTFRELVGRLRAVAVAAFAHQDLPFERLVEELCLERDPSRTPLFQALLVLQNTPASSLAAGGLEIRDLPFPATTAKLDLSLALVEEAGLRGGIEFSSELFDGATAVRFARAFESLLAAALTEPERRLSDLPLLTAAERHQLRIEWNPGPTGAADVREPIHRRFEAQVDRAPGAPAVTVGGETLTYGELDARANRLARHLLALGVRPGDLVALRFERSAELVVALLAALKAGAGYLPLDPSYPAERLAFTLEDSGATLLLTREALEAAAAAIAAQSAVRPEVPADPELPAYVIYTSGSTGRPKGVVIPHGHVTRLFSATEEWFSFGPHDVWTLFHSYAFDFSVWEIWGALLHGGRLVVVPHGVARAPEAFYTLLRDERVTVLNQTPSAFRQLLWAEETLITPALFSRPLPPPSPGEEGEQPDRSNQVPLSRGGGWGGRERGRGEGLGRGSLPAGDTPDLALRYVIFGGEALEVGSLAPWLARHGDERPRLINMYGITETTVHVTYRPIRRVDVEAGRGSVLGEPIPDLTLHVVDAHLALQPIGVPGEIAVGGAGVAPGYLGRPELTAQRFVPDPFGPPGARLYRSGDLARRLPDGDLEYLGRIDHQVKIRGHRIELGEIEAALARHPAVREAVVEPRPGPAGEPRLVTWMVAGADAPSLQDLRAFLAAMRPEPMLPSALVVLDALPLTRNGKVDRRALPAPTDDPGAAADPPATELERFVAGLFQSVLKLPAGRPVGRGEDFFVLGGSSLSGAVLVNRLQKALGEAVPVALIFDAPTPAALAASLIGRIRPIRPISPTDLRAEPDEGPAPLSFPQERLWFLDRLTPGTPLYNIPGPLSLQGPLDVAALARAFDEIRRRHEVLRTRFAERGGTGVQIVEPWRPQLLPVLDLAGLPEPLRRAEAERLTVEETAWPFDLSRGPLLRTFLVRLAGEEHVLLQTVHHIVSDGWSVRLMQRELTALYAAFAAGLPSPLPPLPVQYTDFARWQRRTAGEMERQLAYWRGRLGDDPPRLDLPLDRPRPPVQTFRGGTVRALLPADLADGLRRLAASVRGSLFMALLAGFDLLLARLSGQDDVLVGTPVAGRVHADLEELIGCFLNTLVLRTDLSGNPTFRDLLGRVRGSAVGAYAHQDVPFEALLAALTPERDLSRTPLFQVFFNLGNFPDLGARLPGGLTVEPLSGAEAGSKFDLTIYAAESEEGVALDLVYNAALFDPPRMEEMLRQYASLLAQAVAEPEAPPDRFSLLTPEGAALLPDPVAPQNGAWVGAVHELFAAQARRHPERPAVEDEAGAWTYGELAAAVRGLAAELRTAGIERGDRVAIWAHRSAPLAVAVLGVLEAGAAFVLLDPAYPAVQLVSRLALARPRAWVAVEAAGPAPAEVEAFLETSGVVCRVALPPSLPSLKSLPSLPPLAAGPDDLAYIAFTSGSTGEPKGVLGPHGALSHFLPWIRERFSLGEAERHTMLSGLAHDPLQRDLFTSLCLGGTLCIPSGDDLDTPGRLAVWMARRGITFSNLTPAMAQVLTAGEATVPTLRWAMLIGDVLTGQDVARLRRTAPGVTVVNLYGSTETVRALGYHVVTAGHGGQVLPLGRGMEDTQLLVLRAGAFPVPAVPEVPAVSGFGLLAGIGEVGEICVRSPHLAAGYLDDPELTRERFLAHHTLYRTGDLGRYLPNGEVAFAGRRDQQVKIRGFRVELGEVEAALGRLPGVREAVVVAREDSPGSKRLVAYVVPDGRELAAPALRSSLLEVLPAYMVPAAFVFLDRLPVTPNLKVDRRALPAPEDSTAPSVADGPAGDLERQIAALWREVLGRERVGVHESFFDLGGHSLLAMSLLGRLREAFGVELPVRALFEEPTVAALARRVGEALRESGAGAPPPPLVSVPREGGLPLSFGQERLWFLDRLVPGNPFYNLPGGMRLTGPLEASVLEAALREVARRHETLRTGFAEAGGQPVQRIVSEPAIALPVIDLTALPDEVREAELLRIAAVRARQPFDLARPPLLRTTLVLLRRTEPVEHALLYTIHHIVSDGWSNALLAGEVASLYAAFSRREPSALPPLPVQYADFAAWQRQWLSGEVLERQLSYWRGQLAGAPTLDLPADRPRPPVPSYRGAVRRKVLPGLALALAAGARRGGASSFMVLLAAFQAWLLRVTGQEDVAVGSPVANRARRELEGLIGFFVNTLVLRTDASGDPTFAGLVARAREVCLGALAHQDLPFEQLVENLKPPRDLSRNPLFQVALNLLNVPPPRGEVAAGLALAPLAVPVVTALFDLQAYVAEVGDDLAISWEHSTDLFDGATVERFAGGFATLLAGALAEPHRRLSELPLLAAAERRQLVAEWNDTAAPYPLDGALHSLIEEQAARTPEALAVACGDETLTYAALSSRANRLARCLRELGVSPESRVAVALDRSLELMVALLATLKAGAAYVPLDPDYPRDRLAFMLDDARPALVLTRAGLLESLPEIAGIPVLCLEPGGAESAGRSAANLDVPVSPSQLAYVIYTSGSTGRPKGAMVHHRAIRNRLWWMQEAYGLTAADTVLQKTPFSFDVSVWELFWPLLAGARLVFAPPGEHRDAAALAARIVREGVTVLHFVPSMLAVFLEEPRAADCTRVRLVVASGEALPPGLARRFRERLPWAALDNLYGPTEAAVDVTWHRTSPADERTVPIGRPIANTAIHLVDRNLQPVPAGVTGELMIGGANVGRGYLNRPELTAERFVPDPFGEAGARLYRTGDLARHLPDGRIEYLGRTDHQVKVRGVRIELGEIETVLGSVPAVREAVVVARQEAGGSARLIAYLVPERDTALTAESLAALRTFLAQRLPDAMIPAVFIPLESLPLSPNGKVDRRLPEPEPSRPASVELVPPRDGIERTIAAVWQRLLGLAAVGVHDNFFELGGHSLLGTRVIAALREELGVELPLRTLFEKPTIAALALAVAEARVEQSSEADVDDLLASLENLSDDEVEALLAAMEEPGSPARE
ncbi:MAG TPA: amino acid adenylation domain-containing protein [Thermoanaerobaculia bacterium]|nr:amino acid adenylation domain-containing protein [Thermoanaerobaculia bacterium]